MLYLSLLLLANIVFTWLHYHYRVKKFVRNNGVRRLLIFTPVITTTLAAALLPLYGQPVTPQLFFTVGIIAAIYWFFITLLNIECNKIIQEDLFTKRWHRYQWLQWFFFHCTVAAVAPTPYINPNVFFLLKPFVWFLNHCSFSLALFGIATFLFDGLLNRNWKPQARPWFYVGLHSGGIDSWLSKGEEPERNKMKMYTCWLIVSQLPFIIYVLWPNK